MKKNVASQVITAQLIATADGSDVTSGTTTVYVTGDGGTQGSGSGTVTHEGNGCWSYVPTQAETNYDEIAFTFVNSSAISVTVNVFTDYPQTGDTYGSLPSNFASLSITAGGTVDADAVAISTSTTAADNLEAQILGTVTGTAQAGAAGSITLAAGESSTTDIYAGQTAVILSGTGAGQARVITGYNGTSKVASVSPDWATNPSTDSVYALFPSAPAPTASGSLPQVDVREWIGTAVATPTNAGVPEVDVTHVGGTAEDIATATAVAAIPTDDIATLIGTPADTDVSTDIANAQGDITTLLGRITSTLFSGITSLAEWLGALAGKQAADATAQTEIRATGAGSGTFDATTDSQEAQADAVAGLNDLSSADVTAAVPTAAAVSDAVWEEAIADHSGTSGSTAEQLAAAGAAGDPWATAVPGSYTAGQAGHILGTAIPDVAAGANGGLPTVDASNQIAGIQGTKNTLDDLNDVSATDVNAQMDAALNTAIPGTPTAGSINERLKTMDDADLPTSVAAIKAVTDVIPDSGALTTLVNNVAAILTDTGTTLDGKLDQVIAATITNAAGVDISADVASVSAAIAALNDFDPATDTVTIATDGLDTVTAVDGFTIRELLGLILASVAGELSGAATTTITISNPAGTQTRLTVTVDSDGNRSAVTATTTGI